MTTRDPEDGLRRTRRSLSIASVILILITVAGIKVSGYKLPWIEGDIERPQYVYLAIWIALIYWAIAYLQFLRHSDAGRETYKLVRAGTEVRIRRKLFADYADLIEERRRELINGEHEDAKIEINFFGDWIAVFRGSPIQYGNKYKTSHTAADWKEFHDIELGRPTVRWAQFRAFVAESIKSPILWDYIPLMLVLAAAFCGVYELGVFKGFW